MSATFTCRTARSAAIVGIFVFLVLVETAVLHTVLIRRLPLMAYLVSLVSLASVAWLVADYVSMGGEAVQIEADVVHLRVGLRVRTRVPRAALASVTAPGWQDLGAAAPRYLNATKPATPNVLLVFEPAQDVVLVGAARRTVQRMALHVDDPGGLIAALGAVSRES